MSKPKSRLDWLSASRGYAMYGVFLGHLLITFPPDGAFVFELLTLGQYLNPLVVPFFIILAGAFYSQTKTSFKDYTKFRFSQRIFPVWLYLLLIIPFFFLWPLPDKTGIDSLRLMPLYLLGIPAVSWSSWFLVALFSAEILYYFILPLASNTRRSLLLAAALYSIAWLSGWFSYQSDLYRFIAMIGMLQASVLFCAFFLLGKCVRPFILKLSHWENKQTFLYLCLSIALLLLFTRWNTPHLLTPSDHSFFQFVRNDLIDLSFGQYGHYVWGLACMLSGASALLFFSRLIPASNLMRRCGDSCFVLIGLNGIFLNNLNVHISAWLASHIEQAWLMIACYLVIALMSLLICLPLAEKLEHYLPQLTGKPMLKGPILGALYNKKTVP